jgi:NTP pyrophosphatase (non-canonical NTP hydrolase)
MDMNEYQKLALKTCGTYEGPMRIMAALGLAGETGEVCDIIKKHLFHDHELDQPKLEKELGDVLWYLAVLSHAYGLDLEQVAQTNIAKLKRRYPEGFDAERSKNREE